MGNCGQDRLDALVCGYASIDTIYRANSPPQVGATSILRGPVMSPPRCGGCGPGAAMALACAGCRVGLLTWLGDDAEGQACLRGWTDAGIDVSGVVVAAGQASPRCFLFYDPDGGATCYYHPSGSVGLRLTAQGRDMLSNARALAVTVGPAALTEALLAARRPEQPLAWNVKADANAFPPELRARLTREAAVICLNRDESPFVASALPDGAPLPSQRERGWGEGSSPRADPFLSDSDSLLISAIQSHSGGVVVVTAGAAGGRIVWPDGTADVPAIPVHVADPTGAGDAYFGAFFAGWLSGADPAAAAAAAAEHAAAFLRERAAGETLA